MFRLVAFSSSYANTPQGQVFTGVLNIILVVGLILAAVVLFRGSFGYMASKKPGSDRCPQCYAKIPSGETFCPKCGRERKRSRPFPILVLWSSLVQFRNGSDIWGINSSDVR